MAKKQHNMKDNQSPAQAGSPKNCPDAGQLTQNVNLMPTDANASAAAPENTHETAHDSACEALMRQLAANEGAQPLVDLAARLLDNPVAVGDTSLTVLFTAGEMPEGVPMAHPGMISPDYSTDTDFIKYNEEAYTSPTPIVTGPQFGGYRTVLTRLKVHKQIAGYMSILLIHPLRDNDMELICLIRSAMEAELGKNTSALSQPPKQSEYTLKRLLSGLENPLQNNADLTISLGVDKNAPLYAIVFKMLGYSRANTPGLAIRRELLRMCGSKISVLHENHIVILRQDYLYNQKELTPPYEALLPFLKKYGIGCGISTCFHQITDIYQYYRQALAAMDYFLPRQGAGIYRYEEAAVRLFLQGQLTSEAMPLAKPGPSGDDPEKVPPAAVAPQLAAAPHLLSYCHPAVLTLQAYDAHNHTHYQNVLKAYVENEQNAVLTARQTHLSKASIYRILERIKSITGQTLDTPDALFNMYFSILLLECGQAPIPGDGT